MANQTINIDQLQTELQAWNRKNNRSLVPFVYDKGSQLSQYAKTIPKVNGKYPLSQSVTEHVVQAFRAQWDAMGKTKITARQLEAKRQKVNFELIPNDIYASWLGDMYVEGTDLASMPISKYIMERELLPAVQRDNRLLEITGVFVQDSQAFGASMDGIQEVLNDAIADTTYPVVKVPVAAFTDANIYDEIKKFEKYIMKYMPGMTTLLTKLYMSPNNKLRYKEKYRSLFGTNNDFNTGQAMKTDVLGLEIVALDYFTDSMIFTTPDGNIVKLIDVIDQPPVVTDIQKLDYKLKIFMEWTLSFNFAYNQMVFVSVTSGNSGLGADQSLYYPIN